MIDLKLRLALAALALAILGATAWLSRRAGRPLGGALLTLAAGGAAACLAYFVWAVWRQLRFPMPLECMELTVLQHAQRLASGLPVYPPPSPDFVALAYNPGLYVLLAPLVAIFHPSLTLVRVPAVLATLGIMALFFAAGRRAEGGWRWGLIAAALPVLAFRSLDCYMTKGHSDSLMILCSLGGALLLPPRDDPRRTARGLLAALCFALGFWFKQHGALPAFGGGLYLLLRDRRRAWAPLLALALLGPIAWRLGGPAWFGPDFVDSTWRVPATWSSWDLDGPLRALRYAATWWGVPLAFAAGAWIAAARRRRLLVDPVLFLYPFALLSAVMGSLDHGSSDNVFALAGVWTLLLAVRVLAPHLTPRPATGWQRAAVAALALTAALLVHDFREWLPSARAGAAYADLRATLTGLGGPLYAPWWGDPPAGIPATSRLHWVAIEDRVRGNGATPERSPYVMRLLAPVADASPPAFLLMTHPLESDHLLDWLEGSYVLAEDFGSRFAPVRELPTRFGVRMPRYLYRRVAAGGEGASP